MNMLTKLVACVLVGYGLGAGPLLADDDALGRRLNQIDMERNGLMTDTNKLVNECLKLLDENSSSKDKGEVFAQVAVIYAQNGLTEPEKAAEYCEKALKNPLETTTAAQMYVFWADALQVKHRHASRGEFSAARRETAVICLRGLKVILDQHVPDKRQALPLVQRFDCESPPDSPEHQRLSRKNQEQVAAREKVMAQNTLILHRDALTEKTRVLYSRSPRADGELLRLAWEHLEDEKAVATLFEKVFSADSSQDRDAG
jgi:hypothetical protein